MSTACTRANQSGAGSSGSRGEELRDDEASPLSVSLGAGRPRFLQVDDHGIGTVERGPLDLFRFAPRNEENGAEWSAVHTLVGHNPPSARTPATIGTTRWHSSNTSIARQPRP